MNATADGFLRDRQNGTTEILSVNTSGGQANGQSLVYSISPDARFAGINSFGNNLVSGDTNGTYDVFIRDRSVTGFTSVCSAGVGSVIACPCFNPPAGLEQGCDNSSSTGGAILAASGTAHLSGDTLVLTTSKEKPSALSLVLQGSGFVLGGAIFGQGVRCASGPFLRLYDKTASGGSITAPDFGAGDPSVSSRSAALGDTIQAGQLRWYYVYYRDPTVLGGCPASSTFNATQTGSVIWAP